jgi:primase-polymerase (primpol)-like protein
VSWLPVIAAEIPSWLTSRERWVVWRAERRAGKVTKVPYRIADPRTRASVDDRTSWGRFNDAVDAQSCPVLRLDGIG